MAHMLDHPPLVLVADDELHVRQLLAQTLRYSGFTVITVTNGKAAIDAAKIYGYELRCALLDVGMPVLDGIEAARAIQQQYPDLPLILMTGALPNGSSARLVNLTFVHLLTKPLALAETRTLVKYIVSNPPCMRTVGSAIDRLPPKSDQ